MKSFHEYLAQKDEENLQEVTKKTSAKKDTKKKAASTPSSNRIKGMVALVDSLKKFFGEYDLSTRQFLWDRLTTPKGKELLEKVLRNPHANLTNSVFVQLVTTKK